jgi:plasmid stabilization system protein ParE
MKYTVLWRPLAEQQLARLWTEALDRDAVAAAADKIDDLLRRDPQKWSESRSGATRIIFVQPLVALFELKEQDCMIYVNAISRARRG